MSRPFKELLIPMLAVGGSMAIARLLVSAALAFVMSLGGEAPELGFAMILDYPTIVLCGLAYRLNIISASGINSPFDPAYFIIGESFWFFVGAIAGFFLSLYFMSDARFRARALRAGEK